MQGATGIPTHVQLKTMFGCAHGFANLTLIVLSSSVLGPSPLPPPQLTVRTWVKETLTCLQRTS